MVQRIYSHYENESSLTDVYKGTLFSHLIDLVRFVVSLGTAFWPAKAKMTFIVRHTTYFDQTEQDSCFSSDKPLREDTQFLVKNAAVMKLTSQSSLSDLKLLKHNAEIL